MAEEKGGEDGGGGGRRGPVGKSGRDHADGVSGGRAGGRSHVADRGTHTKREGLRRPLALERITAGRVELYSQVPPPGDNIPITVTPAVLLPWLDRKS